MEQEKKWWVNITTLIRNHKNLCIVEDNRQLRLVFLVCSANEFVKSPIFITNIRETAETILKTMNMALPEKKIVSKPIKWIAGSLFDLKLW